MMCWICCCYVPCHAGSSRISIIVKHLVLSSVHIHRNGFILPHSLLFGGQISNGTRELFLYTVSYDPFWRICLFFIINSTRKLYGNKFKEIITYYLTSLVKTVSSTVLCIIFTIHILIRTGLCYIFIAKLSLFLWSASIDLSHSFLATVLDPSVSLDILLIILGGSAFP